MKIKRFQAHSMAEALRMIKKEFGPDAVILSAKTVKKNKRVFGRHSGQVIVTAAIDRNPAKTARSDEQAVQAQPTESVVAAPTPRLDGAYAPKQSVLERFSPITHTGRQLLRSKLSQIRHEQGREEDQSTTSDQRQTQRLHENLTAQGLASHLATELVEQASGLFSTNPGDQEVRVTLCQIINARQWAVTGSRITEKEPGVSVLLGPPGVGKTTTAAKLAAECTMQKHSTVLISMDNQRAAGTVELERYARLMGIPMYTAFDMEQTQSVIKAFHKANHVIVDTPGLGPQNQDELLELKARLDLLGQAELYLLISAAASTHVMQRSIELYEPLGINRLIITQLDWSDMAGPWINAAVRANLPIAYTSQSPLVSEGLRHTDAPWLTDLLWRPQNEQVREDRVTVVPQRSVSDHRDQFVANSNSDIFHRSVCRSVQRINTQHVVIFKSETEALGRSFKPCRMCCSDLLETKPIDRLPRSSRAAHRYLAR